MTKKEKIGRRYLELQAQGLKGVEIYPTIRKEFGDIADSSVRAYATKVREGATTLQIFRPMVLDVPVSLYQRIEDEANKMGMSVKELVRMILVDYVLKK
jgi:hypothetical protein